MARERGIPVHVATARDDPGLLRALRGADPDLICVSSYRWRLPAAMLELPRRGGINLHTSALPRHRGPEPLFWTYHGDDRTTGVTVHRLESRLDAGDVLCQETFALRRGYPVERLHEDAAVLGSSLLLRAAEMRLEGANGSPQDEARASWAPFVAPGSAMVDFETWDAERTWHFLAGLASRFREPLRDPGGRLVSYRGAPGYEPSAEPPAAGALGRVEVRGDTGLLRCRDGWVRLDLAR